MLDEQMQFWDAHTTLLYEIREELKDLNKNIKALNKPVETTAPLSDTELPSELITPPEEPPTDEQPTNDKTKGK